MKMNPEIKAKWVAALRSGEYRQGDKRVLNDGKGGFCCLGVLCDLYAKERGVDWVQRPGSCHLPDGGSFYPSDSVRGWAHFDEDEKRVILNDRLASVAVHNDGIDTPRCTFAEIADAIEAQL